MISFLLNIIIPRKGKDIKMRYIEGLQKVREYGNKVDKFIAELPEDKSKELQECLDKLIELLKEKPGPMDLAISIMEGYIKIKTKYSREEENG